MGPVSLIVTVLNDVAGTQKFLDRMEEQTYRPDEIIVCDAGSTDGTWELLQTYAASGPIPLVAVQEKRCAVARGRNIGASHAKYDYIAITDIGCDWEAEWMADLLQPIASEQAETVIGSWRVRWQDQETRWAKADFVLGHGYKFLATPQSHGCNRSVVHSKEIYWRLGGMPEDLTFAGEDSTFARLILHATKRIGATREPRCIWERPQTWRAIMKETRRNFKADGEAGLGARHVVLTAFRLMVEIVCVLLFLTAWALPTAYSLPVQLASSTATLTLLWLRLSAYRRRRRDAIAEAQHVPLLDMFLLDYARRYWCIIGYLEGWNIGRTRCQNCRARLRAAGVTWW